MQFKKDEKEIKKKKKVVRPEGGTEPEQQRLRTEEGGAGAGEQTLAAPETPRDREEKLRLWEEKLRQKAQDLKAVKMVLDKKTAELEQRSAMIENAAKGVPPGAGGQVPVGVHHNIPDRATLDDLERHRKKAEDILAHIDGRIEAAKEREERLLNIKTKLEEYKELGYNTSKFDAIDGMSPEEALRLFAEFEKGVDALHTLEERLDPLAEHFPEVVESLKESLNDVDAIPRIEKSIAEMAARLKNEKESYLAKLAEYKAEGLDVAVLEEAIDHDMKTVVKEFAIFEEMVGRIKVVKQKLDSLDPLFDPEIKELREQLRYPELLPDIETRVEGLEDREENKKREFLDKLRTWQEGGYEVTRLENISSGNLGFIDMEFKKFEADVNAMEGYKAKVAALDVDGKEALLALMSNPDNLPSVKQGCAELERRARAKDEETAAAAAASASAAKAKAAEEEPKKRLSLEERKKAIEEARRKRLEEERRRKEEQEAREREERQRAEAEATAATEASVETAEEKESEEPVAETPAEAPPAGEGTDQDPQAVEVTNEMEMTESLIAEAKDKGKDVNSANNLLRLARSFLRSKNYDKALQYTKRSHKMVSDMLGR